MPNRSINVLLPEKTVAAKTDYFVILSGQFSIKGKFSRLQRGGRNYGLFLELVNAKEVNREQMVRILRLRDDKRFRTENTYAIRDVVRNIRETTGLTKDELINCGGALVLNRRLSIYKTPRTAPNRT